MIRWSRAPFSSVSRNCTGGLLGSHVTRTVGDVRVLCVALTSPRRPHSTAMTSRGVGQPSPDRPEPGAPRRSALAAATAHEREPTMTTTANAVSSDGLTSPAGQTARRPARERGWAYAGIGAGLAGIAALVGSSLTDAVYQEEIAGDPAAITDQLADQTGSILVLHIGGVGSGLLVLIFAPGLGRPPT